MKFVKIKNSTLLFLLLMAVLVMGIGYASINSVTGEIKGTLTANSQEGVFITDVTYVSDVGAKLSNCKISKYAGTMMQSTVELSNTNVSSSITYKVTIYNAYKTEAQFAKTIYDNEFYDNQDITFEISGFKPGDIIGSKETKNIIITFKYKGSTIPSNKVLNSYLNFKMEKINRMMVARQGDGTTTYLSGSIAKNKIESIKFIKGKDIPSTATNIFDASESKDESIIGYYTDDDNNGLYELTLISEGTIYTNTDASYLFYYLTNLKSIDFGNFNTTGSLSMRSMFFDCKSLTTIDVSSFDTSKVTYMSSMFYYCKALTTIDLSSFDTSKVTDMNYMFSDCSSLTTIYVKEYNSTTNKGWITAAVTNSDKMFVSCSKLVGENGTKYSSANTDATYARIDKDGEPGYLSMKPYLPSGFTRVAGTTLENGLTIQDSSGNQYVWVEVPKTGEVYPTAGLNIKDFTNDEYTKIETDLHTYTKAYRNGTRYKDEYYSDAITGLTSAQYTELKQKMLKSVYKNGGFYVGKYETGIENAPKTSGSSSTSPTEIPVIKQNAYPYNWVTCSQAQTLASKMESGNYTSSLMFGVQWDLVLKYLETKGTAQADLKTNSTNWGNYYNNLWNITNANSKYTPNGSGWTNGAYGKKYSNKSVLLSTGASEEFSKQGIYDIAGNVWEWTLEYTSNSSSPCAGRGGNCNSSGSFVPAVSRNNFISTNYYDGVGFRGSLY